MDIDKLFKVPKLPPGGNKRKLPDNPSPAMLKKLRMDAASLTTPPHSQVSSLQGSGQQSTAVTMEEVEDEDMDRNFAPGGDADYFTEEDDEGRFFGGGLTSEQKDILNIFDNATGDATEDESSELSITKIRKLLLTFERAVNKNQDQRSKYPGDPSKFIDSEADLDSAIKSLLPLSQSARLAYPELVRSGTITLLAGLLTHENMDIVIDTVELIYELTDEDADTEYEGEEYEEAEEALKILVDGLIENSMLELLVDNLSRLNEADESDRQGVFHILGLSPAPDFNIIGFNPMLSTKLVSNTSILAWLLKRIQSKTHDDNRGYAAELLSIFLQSQHENRVLAGKNDGVEILLKVLSQYRRRDPVNTEETEFMENLFDALCSAVSEPTGKELFLAAEGPDLMMLMIKGKLESRARAIKVLDYAMSGAAGSPICEAFIEAQGLKTLFTAFMGKATKRQKTNSGTPASEEISHILGVISSLLSHLPSDSSSRIRLLAKFVEDEYKKVDKLLEIRDGARKRLQSTEADIEKERQAVGAAEDDEGLAGVEDATYFRRFNGGLFILQLVDYILAWLIMEDDGIRRHSLRMLDRGNQSLQDILRTLRLFYEHVDDDESSKETMTQKDIIQALISALDTTKVT
ncbi:Catenin-beta-like protein [Crassisporium funariophilum]|nr:Catenin-beta-like protein [Crassisporium funariophilum]